MPSQADRDALSRAHRTLLDSLRTVEACSPRAYATDPGYQDCRYARATKRLGIVRRSEYGTLEGAELYPDELLTYQAELALAALDSGRPAEARTLIGTVREQLATRAERGDDAANWSDVPEHVAVVEGRLALLDGDWAAARGRLLASARVLTAPTQLSFGPNMTLARDLLATGDTATVRVYFDALDTTWTDGAETVAEWRGALDRGAAPDFGANLIY